MGNYKFQTLTLNPNKMIFCNSTKPQVNAYYETTIQYLLGGGGGGRGSIKVQIASIVHILWRLAQLSVCLPLASDTHTYSLGKH